MKAALIIPSGGIGKRYGTPNPKQFELISGIPIIIRTLNCFKEVNEIKKIYIPVHADWIEHLDKLIVEHRIEKTIEILQGGPERQDSVFNALKLINPDEYDIVLVHDAVRPFVSKRLITDLIKTAREAGCAISYTKPKDTIRLKTEDNKYTIIDRDKLHSVQTPQVFRTDILQRSYENAKSSSYISTDDAALAEFSGYNPVLIEGDEYNIKITTPFDRTIAESLIKNNYPK
jgi:2-C-methyl-D-erythritol 4-phosphate cytidylyltransferase